LVGGRGRRRRPDTEAAWSISRASPPHRRPWTGRLVGLAMMRDGVVDGPNLSRRDGLRGRVAGGCWSGCRRRRVRLAQTSGHCCGLPGFEPSPQQDGLRSGRSTAERLAPVLSAESMIAGQHALSQCGHTYQWRQHVDSEAHVNRCGEQDRDRATDHQDSWQSMRQNVW